MTVPNSDGDPMSIPVSPRVPSTSWSAYMHTLSEWPKFSAQLYDLDFKKSNVHYIRQHSLLMDNTALRSDNMALCSENMALQSDNSHCEGKLNHYSDVLELWNNQLKLIVTIPSWQKLLLKIVFQKLII
ncbi:hypothetical protein MKX01_011946 [Papaver californicum]|nr:hypothetical protein MKX01_011946 [Papaver californicum]